MKMTRFCSNALLSIACGVVAVLSGNVGAGAQEGSEVKPVPVQSAVVISAENSRISFVGIHVGDDPKPRLGGFKEFSGFAIVDPSSNSLQALNFDINVDSVWTQFEKLTGHLKNEDFFETGKFPTAKFVSTGVESGEGNQCSVTGNLTLHGETKEFSFPAQLNFSESGLVLKAKFNLDRSKFGMDKMLSGVDKMVDVEIVVGEKTAPTAAAPGHGGKSKKKQSSSAKNSTFQQVSLKLPNMT